MHKTAAGPRAVSDTVIGAAEIVKRAADSVDAVASKAEGAAETGRRKGEAKTGRRKGSK